MFNNTKYTKWYWQIVNRAKSRVGPPLGPMERHHVIPAAFGGAELVDLTCREHFICNLLLPRMLEGEAKMKMLWALHFMLFSDCGARYRPRSHTYAHFREKFYNELRGKKRIITEAHRANIAAANKKHKAGKSLSAEHRAAMAKAKVGATLSESHKASIGAAHAGRSKSKEHKLKISAALRGRKQTPEEKAKQSEAQRGRVVSVEQKAKQSASMKAMWAAKQALSA
jgi:hypothetical protein